MTSKQIASFMLGFIGVLTCWLIVCWECTSMQICKKYSILLYFQNFIKILIIIKICTKRKKLILNIIQNFHFRWKNWIWWTKERNLIFKKQKFENFDFLENFIGIFRKIYENFGGSLETASENVEEIAKQIYNNFGKWRKCSCNFGVNNVFWRNWGKKCRHFWKIMIKFSSTTKASQKLKINFIEIEKMLEKFQKKIN